MKTFTMAQTDMQVSQLAYGCMALGRFWEEGELTPAIQDSVNAALDQALESGYNYFDHADIYHAGKCEQLFGHWYKDREISRDKIYIQSKCGIKFPPVEYDFSYEHVMERTKRSIEYLQCNYLDALVLHRPDVLMDIDEVAKTFDELHTQGLVRHFGVSNQAPATMRYLASALSAPLICNQFQLSILHHHELSSMVDWNMPNRCLTYEGIVEYCNLEQICMQPWAPLAKGFLDTRAPAEDHGQFEQITAVQKILNELAEKENCAPSAIALAWLLRIPGQVQPIVGTASPQRIKEAAEAVNVQLSRHDWYRLFEAGRGIGLP